MYTELSTHVHVSYHGRTPHVNLFSVELYGKYWLNVGSISYNEKIHEKNISSIKKKNTLHVF